MNDLTIDSCVMLDDEIQEAHHRLRELKIGSEEYDAAIKGLAQLYSIREDVKKKDRISADTKALIAANLAGIVLILSYEKVNVISTKALNFVMKGRI